MGEKRKIFWGHGAVMGDVSRRECSVREGEIKRCVPQVLRF